MNQAILGILEHVQESLISIREEDEQITDITRTTASVEDLAPHFRMLRHYVSRLRPLLDAFEVEEFRDQQERQQAKEKSIEAASKV